jgi:hypothetical protein
MATNEFEIVEYLDEARTRVTDQFKDKPTFDKYLDLILRGSLELQETLQQLQQLRSVDTATGVNLDNIGEIVGIPRGLLSAELFYYFGNRDLDQIIANPQAGKYGSLTDSSIGSPWYSLNAPLGISREPSDEEYRLIIKAKIIKNRTLARPEDVIEAYKFLFGTSQVVIDEFAPAKVRIGIGKILSSVERGLLFNLQGSGSLLPKTAGVNYQYQEYEATRVFALAGFPGALGPGDLNDPAAGGFLSNIIS